MENIMVTMTEASNAVLSGAGGTPRFLLSADDAERILAACRAAKIAGPLADKVQTLYNYSAAKERLAGRQAVVKME